MYSFRVARCLNFIYTLHIYAEKTEYSSAEPVCYSRFDYDLKILRTMASLEESDVQLSETTRTLQNEVQGIKSSIKGLNFFSIRH